jgi:hypothetical protein
MNGRARQTERAGWAGFWPELAGIVFVVAAVIVFAAMVLPVRWNDEPGEGRATLAIGEAVRDGRPTYAAGCVDVRADGETWRNLSGARYLVRTVDAVGDGSVWVFVNGTFVAWSDGPDDLVTACAPAELAAAIGEAQP